MSNEPKQPETLLLQSDVEPNIIEFKVGEFIETPIITLRGNGDIFVKGKLIENDLELVDGLREFLNITNIQIDKTKTDSNQSSVEQLMWKLWDTPKDKFTWHTIMKYYSERHKQEICKTYIDAMKECMINPLGDAMYQIDAEQYYNETFE